MLAGMMVLSLSSCGAGRNKEQLDGGDPSSWAPKSAEAEKTDEQLDGGDPSSWAPQSDEKDGETVQVPTPYKEYSSMEEAKAAAGFELRVPDTANGLSRSAILVYEELKMVQVDFGDGSSTVSIRKEASDSDGTKDISGVYTEYAENNTVTHNDRSINLKGENRKVYVAAWSADNYNYSIYSEAGMEQEEILALAAEIQ